MLVCLLWFKTRRRYHTFIIEAAKCHATPSVFRCRAGLKRHALGRAHDRLEWKVARSNVKDNNETRTIDQHSKPPGSSSAHGSTLQFLPSAAILSNPIYSLRHAFQLIAIALAFPCSAHSSQSSNFSPAVLTAVLPYNHEWSGLHL